MEKNSSRWNIWAINLQILIQKKGIYRHYHNALNLHGNHFFSKSDRIPINTSWYILIRNFLMIVAANESRWNWISILFFDVSKRLENTFSWKKIEELPFLYVSVDLKKANSWNTTTTNTVKINFLSYISLFENNLQKLWSRYLIFNNNLIWKIKMNLGTWYISVGK